MGSVSPLSRDSKAQQTRQTLLECAQLEIHRVGFQAASLDRILLNSGVTKGALYHHFPSKLALGYAVVDEWLRNEIETSWIAPLEGTKDPITTLSQMLVVQRHRGVEWLKLGCPLAALAQEMSSLDEGFRERIQSIYTDWQDAISSAIISGQAKGLVSRNFGADQTAMVFIAAIEGTLLLGKASQSSEPVSQCGMAMMQFLSAMRMPNT